MRFAPRDLPFVTAFVVAAGCAGVACGAIEDPATLGHGAPGAGGQAGTPEGGAGSGAGGGGASGGSGGSGGKRDGGAGSAGTGGEAGSSGSAGSGGTPIVSESSAISAIEAETTIAAGSNGFVAVAYIAVTFGAGSSNGYVFSKDDGKSWGIPSKVDSPGGAASSDPVLAVTSHDDFYLTWIGYRVDGLGNPSDMHVYVSRADRGTTKFGVPTEVTAPGPGDRYDKPWITVMPDDTIVVTYARTSDGSIWAARSTDGASWTSSAIAPPSGAFRNLLHPCHAAAGERLYVTYLTDGAVSLRWSDDGGVTWAADALAQGVALVQEGPIGYQDPTCAASGNDVWIAYGLTHDPQGGTASTAKLDRIVVARSTDGGLTFPARHDAHDVAAGTYFLLPQLVREAGGALDIVYYAGNAEGDFAGSFRRARSTDGAATWGPSAIVHAPITFQTTRSSTSWLGDYVGLSSTGTSVYASFADNQPSFSHVAFFGTDSP